jgi:hypothetical protein
LGKGPVDTITQAICSTAGRVAEVGHGGSMITKVPSGAPEEVYRRAVADEIVDVYGPDDQMVVK